MKILMGTLSERRFVNINWKTEQCFHKTKTNIITFVIESTNY